VALTVGEKVLVRKLDYATGHVLISWPGTLVELTDERAVIRAPFASISGGPVFVDGVPFSVGDTFTEFYFLKRCYNVFHVADAQGRPKGWYCNVTKMPELDESGITFVDLALDLFAHPDGRYTVLDEDEFAEAESQVYAPEDAAQARLAISELVDLARDGKLPTPDDVA
jgi:predicted RNA-binding protein associated with RNAse of E/G family